MKGINFIIIQFNKLKERQKALLIFLIGAIIFSFYFNTFYKSKIAQINCLRTEIASVNSQISELRAQMPNVDGARSLLIAILDKHASLKTQVKFSESQLPTQHRTPQFLGELVAQAQGLNIDFISIKSKQTSPLRQVKPEQEEQKKYAHLNIELRFNSDYFNLVDYLNRLENLSPFLVINHISREQTDKKIAQGNTSLSLSTLLDESLKVSQPEEELVIEKPSAISIDKILLERDPFASALKPIKKPKKEDKQTKKRYVLSGITVREEQSTAIIDGEVYSVGSTFKNLTIKKILPDMVILVPLQGERLAGTDDVEQEIILLLENNDD